MHSRFNALAVHSQPEALGELVDLLSGPELRVVTARSTTEALHKIAAESFSIILVGHRPPIMDGVELLEKSVSILPDALRILLVSNPHDAIELDYRPSHTGTIIRFVATGRERSRLVGLVGEGLKLLRLVEEQRTMVRNLGSEYERLQRREKLLDVVVKERTKELEESYEKLKEANRQALFGLAEAIEVKDPYTKGHCSRVAGYVMLLAHESGYPEEGLETLEFGAFLHDIGKIGIRDAVLLKPGPLSEEEWEHMRQHPVMGYEIASKIEMLHPIMPAVRSHHERWDGKGYPDGLSGEDIPLPARLVAIADAYDSMATSRPYKSALSLEQCEKLLLQNCGKMFDPALVEVFCAQHIGAAYRADQNGLQFVISSVRPRADEPGEGAQAPDSAEGRVKAKG